MKSASGHRMEDRNLVAIAHRLIHMRDLVVDCEAHGTARRKLRCERPSARAKRLDGACDARRVMHCQLERLPARSEGLAQPREIDESKRDEGRGGIAHGEPPTEMRRNVAVRHVHCTTRSGACPLTLGTWRG